MTAVEIAEPYLDPHADELLAAVPVPRKALFLDRDGVINVNHGYVHKPEDTEWVSGIFELCASAQRAGYLIVVVTNQAGIARGYYDVEEFLYYTRWMHEQFSLKGAPLTATFYCPHHREGIDAELAVPCVCRKPKPGMILSAIHKFAIDSGASILIGDSQTDVQAGAAAGLAKSLMIGSDIPEINKLFYREMPEPQ